MTSHITLIKELFRAVFCWNHFQTCILVPLPSIPVIFFLSFILRSQWGTIGEVFPAVSLWCVALALCPGSREPKQAPRLTSTSQQREKPKLHLGSATSYVSQNQIQDQLVLFSVLPSVAGQVDPKNSAFYRACTGVNLTKTSSRIYLAYFIILSIFSHTCTN